MSSAILIHNPTAGDEEHSRKKLVKLIESFGYEVDYYNTDLPGWNRFLKRNAEKIFVAGGDGTVQAVAAELLKASPHFRQTPVQILPMGTANNIATTLKLEVNDEKISNKEKTTGFDTGKIKGVKDVDFFIEGIGFGIFPALVKQMKSAEEPEAPEDELKQSLKNLLKIVEDYEAREVIIIADGEEITGKFLLVECMNIRYIGPNFELAPNAKPGDGEFELVAIPEVGREKLKHYVKNLLEENSRQLYLEEFALLRKVKEVRIKWQGEDLHIDDEVDLDYHSEEIEITNNPGSFIFSTAD